MGNIITFIHFIIPEGSEPSNTYINKPNNRKLLEFMTQNSRITGYVQLDSVAMTFTEFVLSITWDRELKEVTVVAKGSKNVRCV